MAVGRHIRYARLEAAEALAMNTRVVDWLGIIGSGSRAVAVGL